MPRVLRGVGWFVLLAMSIAACESSASSTLVAADSGAPPGQAATTVVTADPAAPEPAPADPTAATPTALDPVAATPTEVHFPARLDFTVDTATATSVDITAAAGGKVAVTAADGTTYTLDVPPEALAQDTTITAAALSDVSGVPEAETMSGVQFGPDGLRFFGFATLTIVPPAGMSSDVSLAFTAESNGSKPHPAFTAPDTADMQILVSHFTLFGRFTFRGYLRELLPLLGFEEVSIGIESDMASLVGFRDRIKELGSDSPEIDLRISQDFTRYLEEVVTPAVEDVGSDCESTRDAAVAASNFVLLQEVYKPNGVPSLRAVAEAAFAKAESVCEREAIALCKKENDASILVDYWTTMRGWRNRLGFAPKPGDNPSQYLKKARPICEKIIYVASGGGPKIIISGIVEDLAAEFTLDGFFDGGGSARFTFSPAGETAGSYTYTLAPFSGGGGGSYTIEGTPGEILTLRTKASGCVVIGTCANTADLITLTPQDNLD